MSLRSSTGRSNAASVSRVLRRERVAGLADRRALLVERAHHAGGGAAVGAQHLHGHLRRGILGRDQRQRRRRAALEHRQRAIPDGLAQAFEKLRARARYRRRPTARRSRSRRWP